MLSFFLPPQYLQLYATFAVKFKHYANQFQKNKMATQKKLFLSSAFMLAFFFLTNSNIQAQYLMDMVDTTKAMGKDMLGLYKKFNAIKLSGYIQPQFQVAQSAGEKSFGGGDFSPTVKNRFMLRRSRVKFDYATFSETKMPKFQFVFQLDATERGVNARDMWGRFFENKYNCFSLTTGLFARPFGFEINYSSGDRESPERGRMSQILMRTERDIGAMVSFMPQRKDHPLKQLQIDLGVFNGEGLSGPTEFDSNKDIIGRIQWKKQPLSKNVFLSFGASYLNGGIRQNNKIINRMTGKTLDFTAVTDSLAIGTRSPRTYMGADAQLKIENHFGNTELRAEYVTGTQTGVAATSETPGTAVSDPLFVRPFNGAYLYLLQSFGKKHQLGIKYDWYDPNTHVQSSDLKKDTKLSAADLKYNTLGFGYIFYMNENLKWVFWYDIIKNEKTQLTGLTEDLKDNLLTIRAQYKF